MLLKPGMPYDSGARRRDRAQPARARHLPRCARRHRAERQRPHPARGDEGRLEHLPDLRHHHRRRAVGGGHRRRPRPTCSASPPPDWSATAAILIAPPGSLRSGSRACSAGTSTSGCRSRNARMARFISGQVGTAVLLPLQPLGARVAMPPTSTATCSSSPTASSRRIETLSRQLTLVRAGWGARTQGLAPGIPAGGHHRPAAIELVPPESRHRAAGRHHAGRPSARICSMLHARYAVVENVRSFGRAEDYAVGPSLRVGLLAAPSAFGYAEGGAGVQLTASAGIRLPRGLRAAQCRRQRARHRVRRRLRVGGLQGEPRHPAQPRRTPSSPAASSAGRRIPFREASSTSAWCTGRAPIRSTPSPGDRGFLVAAEYRWTFAENLGGLLGLALGTFVDYGGAWYAGEVTAHRHRFRRGTALRSESFGQSGSVPARPGLSRRGGTVRRRMVDRVR